MEMRELCETSGGGYYYELVRLKEEARGIKVLYVPHGAEIIRHNCFEDSLAEAVMLSDGVKQIGREAFKNCKNLRYIYLSDSVEVIERDALLGCENAEIYCRQEGYCWVHPEQFDDLYRSDAFNFHRSSGSWNTPSLQPITDADPRPYNPLNRPIHRGVSPEDFKAIIAAAGLPISSANR